MKRLIDPTKDLRCESVQGCGMVGCPICMPKSEASSNASAPATASSREFVVTFDVENIDVENIVARSFRAAFERPGNPDQARSPKSDPARERLIAAERSARGPVRQYILEDRLQVAWNDVVGNEMARRELIDAIEHPVRHKELFRAYGRKPGKGVLLYGPPGCGKTMLGKAAASALQQLFPGREQDVPAMLHVKGPEIQSPYVGVTEGVIRAIFAYARAYKALRGHPLVLFVDEADAIMPSRDGGGGRTRRALPWEESNVATFLAEMDGLEESGAFVILATNRPYAIDAALLRDGRCDRKIRIERPDRAAARVLFEKQLAGIPLAGGTAAELAELAAGAVFSPDGRRLFQLRSEKGRDFLTLAHIVSGAMIVGLVERAKAIAFARDLAVGAGVSGVGAADLEAAIDAVARESRGLDHSYAIEEYCERLGIEGVAIEALRRGSLEGMLQ